MELTNLEQIETLLADFQLSRDFCRIMLYLAEKFCGLGVTIHYLPNFLKLNNSQTKNLETRPETLESKNLRLRKLLKMAEGLEKVPRT
jgi:dynactin complex subunit